MCLDGDRGNEELEEEREPKGETQTIKKMALNAKMDHTENTSFRLPGTAGLTTHGHRACMERKLVVVFEPKEPNERSVGDETSASGEART